MPNDHVQLIEVCLHHPVHVVTEMTKHIATYGTQCSGVQSILHAISWGRGWGQEMDFQ